MISTAAQKIYYYDEKNLWSSVSNWQIQRMDTNYIHHRKSIKNRTTETRMWLSKDNKKKQKAFEKFKGYVKWEEWADYKCR